MTQLLYVADPMCSWCWGFAPGFAKATAQLRDGVTVRLVLGGLAPDSDTPMEPAMLGYIQNAWRAVAARSGVEFNHEFWREHHPRRSTWPACRAVLAAGEQGREMFAAIQRAYYLDARDPSDKATLVELGVELGFERAAFAEAIDAPETRAQLAEEFELRDRLGVTGYPSVGLERNGELRLLTEGWNDASALREVFAGAGLLR